MRRLETPDPLGLRFFELAADETWEMHTGFAWATAATQAPTPLRPDLGWAGWLPRSRQS